MYLLHHLKVHLSRTRTSDTPPTDHEVAGGWPEGEIGCRRSEHWLSLCGTKGVAVSSMVEVVCAIKMRTLGSEGQRGLAVLQK